MPSEIDAVILWVDGADPRHIEKRQKYIDNEPWRIHSAATVKTRFYDSGEIYWCIASIIKYAKFIRKVWIVTDDQSPVLLKKFASDGICESSFISIVDHKEIFRDYESYLPTFNSRSIESLIWRIQGLAENFIYLNDDMFFNRPQSEFDWFEDGLPVLRGDLVRNNKTRIKSKVKLLIRQLLLLGPSASPSFSKSQERAAEITGLKDKYWTLEHHPHPIRRSTLEVFYRDNPDVLNEQIKYRFRNFNQYSPASLANHLEIVKHRAKVRTRQKIAYVDPKSFDPRSDVIYSIRESIDHYGCIQSLDSLSDIARAQLLSVVLTKFDSFLPNEVKAALKA